ncbi:MAG TPA: hypothetical protein VKL40_06645 [Candidatus Angelobacter sp.]|nr:hypothetical protein [Candidatus Angelobacter sp.]
MNKHEQTSQKKASDAVKLAGMGADIVGEFAQDGFIGAVLYVVIMVPIVLIRTAFLDW